MWHLTSANMDIPNVFPVRTATSSCHTLVAEWRSQGAGAGCPVLFNQRVSTNEDGKLRASLCNEEVPGGTDNSERVSNLPS